MLAVKCSLVGARERFESARNGKYIPPPKPNVQLSEEQSNTFLDAFAAKLAKLYRAQEGTND